MPDSYPPAPETTFRDGPWHTADRDLGSAIQTLRAAREAIRVEAQTLRTHPHLFDEATIESAQTARAVDVNTVGSGSSTSRPSWRAPERPRRWT